MRSLRFFYVMGAVLALAGCGGSGGDVSPGLPGAAGLPGVMSLVKLDSEPVGSNCPAGGSRISAGLDSNRNDVLDASEISQSRFACNGGSGTNGTNGTNGINGSGGSAVVVKTGIEPAGAQCAAGGTSVRVGLDANANNLLDASEVTSADFVCNGLAGQNGANGLTSLITTGSEAAGTNCAHGGTRFSTGMDLNANGILEPSEVTSSSYACNGNPGSSGNNGTNGTNGNNGSNGTNGMNSLIRLRPEPAGVNCAAGGTGIEAGLDGNRNNVLDNLEVTSTSYICKTILAPTGMLVAYSAKRFDFSWTPVANASSYRLLEDPDGTGPLPSTVVGSATTASYSYTIPEFLLTRLNATYAVQACEVNGCSASSNSIQPNISQAIGYFKASNPGANDIYGNAIALSADGLTLAVSAYGEASAGGAGPQDDSAPSAGAVYVYTKSQGQWTQQAMLKAPNAAASHFFGKSLALSADGNTLAVGADGEGSNHRGTFAVMPTGNALAPDSGAVYVYARAGNAWAQQAYIKAANAETFDIFGFAVALSADGNTLAVGAWYEAGGGSGTTADPSDNSGFARGAAYVFTRTGNNWSQAAYLKATNSGDGDWFGFSLALSGDGNTLAVGAMNESSNSVTDPANNSAQNSGAVYVYTRLANTWSAQSYLKAPVPEANDNFGVYLAVSGDGSTLAIGMHGDDSNLTGAFSTMPADNNLATNSGAVFVFTRAGSVWAQQAYIKASNVNVSTPARFGRRFALSENGNILAVSAFREDGAGIGFASDPTSTAALDAGAVYMFDRSGATWAQRAYIKASNTNARDRFGIGLAMTPDGRTLAVGAEGEGSPATGVGGNQADNSLVRAGAVYLY